PLEASPAPLPDEPSARVRPADAHPDLAASTSKKSADRTSAQAAAMCARVRIDPPAPDSAGPHSSPARGAPAGRKSRPTGAPARKRAAPAVPPDNPIPSPPETAADLPEEQAAAST